MSLLAGNGVGLAVALGLVQGATEFLPVSSSGHLVVMSMLWDAPTPSLALMVLLHAATLLSTLLVFGRDIGSIVLCAARGLRSPSLLRDSDEGRFMLGLGAATLATAVVGLTLEPWVQQWSSLRWLVGLCFLGSAVALVMTRRHHGLGDHLSLRAAVLVGAAQGLAALPGLSRSGVTMAVAMWLGLNPAAAFRYSFLLSVPVIAGASVLELGKPENFSALGTDAFVGGATALVVGYAALLALRALVGRGQLWTFATYLVPLGTALLIADLVGHVTN